MFLMIALSLAPAWLNCNDVQYCIIDLLYKVAYKLLILSLKYCCRSQTISFKTSLIPSKSIMLLEQYVLSICTNTVKVKIQLYMV